MARPKARPYMLGTVTFLEMPAGKTGKRRVQARGYFRDRNHRRHDVTAVASSKTAAEIALKAKVKAAEAAYQGGDSQLNSQTTLAEAARIWLDWKARQVERGKRITPRTMRDYEGYVLRTITGGTVVTGKVWPANPLSTLPLSEVNNLSRLEGWLARIADDHGETAAEQSKKVMSGILGLAERREAIPASVVKRVKLPGATPGSAGDSKCRDPECDYDCGKRHLDTRRAFSAEELVIVQETADARRCDVGDLTAFLFGTGARISEALHHTAWVDLNWDNGTVRVRGTKTAHADRTLALSEELLARLKRRAAAFGTQGLIFGTTYYASKLGRPRDPANVGKRMREVFAFADVRWAGTHTFRRTVASWMDEAGCSLAEIANQLGHADTNVTAGYLGRRTQPTKARHVMVMPPPKKAPAPSAVRG